MKKGIISFHWLPRLLTIAAILFISSFSLDSYRNNIPFPRQVAETCMHLLPSLVLIAMLVIAWRWEKVGGMVFIATAIGLMPFIYNLNHRRNHFSASQSLTVLLIINLPFLLAGILFLISHYKKDATENQRPD